MLGVADADVLFGALDAVIAADPRAALLAIARLAESGRDIGQFLHDLEAHARELLVVQTLGEVPAEIAMTPERDERLAAQAARIARGDVVRLLDLLAGALRAVRDGADARTQLELALVKAAAPETDPSTRALLARIERLEGALRGGGGAAAATPVAAASPAPAAPAPPAAARAAAGSVVVAARQRRARRARAGARGRPARARPDPVAAARGPDGPRRRAQPVARRPRRAARRPAARRRGARRGPAGRRPRRRAADRVRDDRQLPAREAEKSANRQAIAETIRAVTGASPPLRFESRDLRSSARRRAARRSARPPQEGVQRGGDLLMPQPNMHQMLKQVQKMQQDMAAAQEQLKHEEVEASAGGGMVTVTVTGDLVVKSITIDPAAIDPDDPELLQDMVLAAVNEALRAAQELAATKMGGLTGGLDLGGLGLPGM